MKFLILAIAVACVQALPDSDSDAQVLKYNFDINGDGQYQYAYETSNGIAAQEDGTLRVAPGSDYPSIEAKGSYKFTSSDGVPVEVTYVADENGYQPQGSHLPTPPPVPDYILRSIQYIEAHPPPPPRP